MEVDTSTDEEMMPKTKRNMKMKMKMKMRIKYDCV